MSGRVPPAPLTLSLPLLDSPRQGSAVTSSRRNQTSPSSGRPTMGLAESPSLPALGSRATTPSNVGSSAVGLDGSPGGRKGARGALAVQALGGGSSPSSIAGKLPAASPAGSCHGRSQRRFRTIEPRFPERESGGPVRAPVISRSEASVRRTAGRNPRRARTVVDVPPLTDVEPAGDATGLPSPREVAHRTPSKDVRAPLFAARYRLQLNEVRHILQEFDKTTSLSGEEKAVTSWDFRDLLCRVFGVSSLPSEALDSAYEACGCSGGAVTVEDFLQWYTINMFTVVNLLNADTDQAASDSLIYSLARKHQVPTMVIDKAKSKFDLYDADGNGFIDMDEFRYLLSVLMKAKTGSELSEDRVVRAWKEIHGRGNGSGVTFPEFTEWYLKYLEPPTNEDFDDLTPAESFYDSFSPMVQRRLYASKERTLQ